MKLNRNIQQSKKVSVGLERSLCKQQEVSRNTQIFKQALNTYFINIYFKTSIPQINLTKGSISGFMIIAFFI